MLCVKVYPLDYAFFFSILLLTFFLYNSTLQKAKIEWKTWVCKLIPSISILMEFANLLFFCFSFMNSSTVGTPLVGGEYIMIYEGGVAGKFPLIIWLSFCSTTVQPLQICFISCYIKYCLDISLWIGTQPLL